MTKFDDELKERREKTKAPVLDHDWFVYLRWTEDHGGYPYDFAVPEAFSTEERALHRAREWAAEHPERSVDGPHKVYRARNKG